MNKSRVQKIVWFFQKNDTNDIIFEKSSQYLIDIIKLIDVNFIMTKARRLMQLNFEWMSRNEQQTRKKINKIIQKDQTYIYVLYFEDSQVKQMIHDRQNRRVHMMNLILNLNLINVFKVTRDIEDDENDNSDEKAKEMNNSNLRSKI
jgi:hypothetical protein